ncbi:hypothetical protein SAMN06298216_1514 [Spirosomataceae bacterium TFI 002]|nr:hypothetical protein SAMN06298216_1514 [Spirosomataceae bacterium TFI 002]
MNKETILTKALKNQLSEDEELVFKKNMVEDNEYAEQYAFELNIKKSVVSDQREKLKQKLQAHEAKTSQNLKPWIWWAAAAVFIGVSVMGWYFLKPSSNQDMFSANYEKFPNIIAPITRSDSERLTAFKSYDTGDYDQAYELFSKLSTEKSAPFFQGICLIEMGKTAEAINHFQAISFGDEYDDHRLWYLSLLYIKKGDNEAAKPILNHLADGNSVWNSKARLLLQKM